MSPETHKIAKKRKRLTVEQRLAEFERLSERIRTTLESAGVTREALIANLPKIRKALYQKHYGTKK